MADVRIKVLKDGPLEVKGPVKLVDAKRQEFSLAEDPIYLCRCGLSQTKPFCDGSHQTANFRADDPAR